MNPIICQPEIASPRNTLGTKLAQDELTTATPEDNLFAQIGIAFLGAIEKGEESRVAGSDAN